MLVLLAAFITIGGTTSCKSKKQLAKEAAEAEYKARVSEAIRDLTAILNDEVVWTLEEKENRVQTIKDWNLQNAEVDDLLFQVEKKLARERAQAEQRAREEAEAARAAEEAKQPKNMLERNFASICNASTAVARPFPLFARANTVPRAVPRREVMPSNVDTPMT